MISYFRLVDSNTHRDNDVEYSLNAEKSRLADVIDVLRRGITDDDDVGGNQQQHSLTEDNSVINYHHH